MQFQHSCFQKMVQTEWTRLFIVLQPAPSRATSN